MLLEVDFGTGPQVARDLERVSLQLQVAAVVGIAVAAAARAAAGMVAAVVGSY